MPLPSITHRVGSDSDASFMMHTTGQPHSSASNTAVDHSYMYTHSTCRNSAASSCAERSGTRVEISIDSAVTGCSVPPRRRWRLMKTAVPLRRASSTPSLLKMRVSTSGMRSRSAFHSSGTSDGPNVKMRSSGCRVIGSPLMRPGSASR